MEDSFFILLFLSTCRQLRARRALTMSKEVLLRTRWALSLYKVYINSSLLVLNGISLNIDSSLLVLNGISFNIDSALLAVNCRCILQHISLTESQKGVNAVHSCFVEDKKGAIDILLYSYSALLVLNGISLNSINALLALNWRNGRVVFHSSFYSHVSYNIFRRLRARRALTLITHIPLRTKRALNATRIVPKKLQSDFWHQ